MVTEPEHNKPKPGEVEVSKSRTEKILHSGRCYSKAYTPEGREFFIFADYGDQINGKLLYGSRDNNHIGRTKSFRIETVAKTQNGVQTEPPPGTIDEFFVNRQLQAIFRQNDLVGKYIRIVYVAREKSQWGGRASKVYRVFLDKGFVQEREVEVNAKVRKRKNKRAGRKSA